jgi:hypothetical protein
VGAVEIGYAIAPEHQRRGYATEAVQALLSQAFDHVEVVVVPAVSRPRLPPKCSCAARLPWLALPSLRLKLAEQLQLREQDRLLEVSCSW